MCGQFLTTGKQVQKPRDFNVNEMVDIKHQSKDCCQKKPFVSKASKYIYAEKTSSLAGIYPKL